MGKDTVRNESAEVSENHYVLIIHGTGAAPEPGRIKWYQLDPGDESNFCLRLERVLGELGWAGAVWRQPPGSADSRPLEFSWSGGNSHQARLAGGRKLDQLLRRIREADPRCRIHLVAHSHGGNVLLAGLDGYLRWMRHLAGAETEGRSAAASMSAWAKGLDPEFHRLGRLVFLGTPFYYKCWLKGTSAIARLFDTAGRWLRPLVFCLGFLYLMVVAVAGLIGLLPAVDFIGWQPWRWSWVVLAVWLLPSLLATLGASQDKLRRDINLYFPGFLDVGEILGREGRAGPIESMVVSAGLLDEALLVLAAQPLASAFLLPPMREVLRPRWWRRLRPVAAGTRNEAPEQWGRFLKGAFLIVINTVTLPVTLLRRLLSRPLGAWLAGRTRNALGSAALGVPAWELEDARIEVRSRLEAVPGLLGSTVWEIERRLAAEPPPPRTHEASRLYPFLLDDDRIDEALAESDVWRRVERELPVVLRRLGRMDEKDEQARIRRLQRICLTLEARGREIIGSIELLHSAYYARPEFVRAVARFLVSGKTPAPGS